MYGAGGPSSSSLILGAISLAAKSPVSEETILLQRRLAEESAERDASKSLLQRAARTVDFYRQRLAALAGSGAGGAEVASANLQRVREIIQAVEAEVRAIPSSDQALLDFTNQSPCQGYDVLRQSLEEAQRRCESLNCDMVHQAEANEELVEALGTVKDANKRLLEQIRFQTDEIAQLTQQRIGDEERMDRMTRKHQADQETFRQNLQRQIAAIRTLAGEEYGACSRHLVDKLRYLRTRIEIIGQDAGRLHQERERLRMDVSTMVEAMQAQLRSAERDVSARCTDHSEAGAKKTQALEEAIEELEGKLSAERDTRHNEGLSWGHRHGLLLAEREDVQARTSRDLSQFSSQLQALERTLAAERHAATAERQRLERLQEESGQRHVNSMRDNDQIQRDLVRVESAKSATDSEIRGKEQSVAEFRRQIRESDDALAAAVSGNEHLRDQMEEQRRRFQEKNEADLGDARASFEQKFNDARLVQDSDVTASARELQEMEEAVDRDEEALQALRTQCSFVNGEIDSHGRDSHMWRSQNDAAKASRGAVEKEFKEARQTYAGERLKLQAAIDRLEGRTASTEDEIKRTWDHINEFRRLSGARETEQVTRTGAAESLVREAQEQLANLKKYFVEAVDARNRAESEVSCARQRALEVQGELEQDLDKQRQITEEEKQRRAEQLAIDTRATNQARDQLDREKETSVAMLRRMQEESRSKLGAAERERVRIEETCRADNVGASESVLQQQKYADSLEHDLHRLRYLLTESEANYAWVKQELDREERETGLNLRQLQNDSQTTAAELEKAVKSDSALTRQLEDISTRNQQEQARLAKEMEAIRRSASGEQSEAEAKLSRARTDIQLDLRSSDERRRSVLDTDKMQEEALERENTQLKGFLAEQNATSGGLSSLHNKLETHIQRLQRHTEDLRRDIHSSAAPAALTSTAAASQGHIQTMDILQRSPQRALSPTKATLLQGDGELRLELRAHIANTPALPQDMLYTTTANQLLTSPKLVGGSFTLGGSGRPGDISGLGRHF